MEDRPRTNNHMEGYHNKLQSKLQAAAHDPHKIIQALAKNQMLVEHRILG